MDTNSISVPTAALTALLGYAVVFLGLVLLMLVVMLLGRVMIRRAQRASKTASDAEIAPSAEPAPEAKAPAAPGSAGELKLYDTDPRDAAMIMAIVADTLGKPLNELRFISIREVKEK